MQSYAIRNIPEAEEHEVKAGIENGFIRDLPCIQLHESITTKTPSFLQEGDRVLLLCGFNIGDTVVLKSGDQYSNRMGNWLHDLFIGKKKIGDKVWCNQNKVWLIISPHHADIHSATVRHRTQILYSMDISFCLCLMDLKMGSRVIESGTGSGSMTVALSYSVGRNGHVYTFEYNEARAEAAKSEFKDLQLNNITVTHRDVVKNGFSLMNNDNEGVHRDFNNNNIDAAFLDLPEPELALRDVVQRLKPSGVLIIFLPSVEQMTRTIHVLCNDLGLEKHLTAYECGNYQYNIQMSNSMNTKLGENDIKFHGEYPRTIDASHCYLSKQNQRGHTGYLIKVINKS